VYVAPEAAFVTTEQPFCSQPSALTPLASNLLALQVKAVQVERSEQSTQVAAVTEMDAQYILPPMQVTPSVAEEQLVADASQGATPVQVEMTMFQEFVPEISMEEEGLMIMTTARSFIHGLM
jgi:hypothetical protein